MRAKAILRLSALSFLSLQCLSGCSGPERGFLAEFRGRTQVRHDLLDEEALFRSAPSSDGLSGEKPAKEGASRFPLFPLAFFESTERATSFEALWPFLEVGKSQEAIRLDAPPGPSLEPPSPPGETGGTASGDASREDRAPSSYFRLRPILYIDSFRGYSRTVIFPFYFRIREKLEAGDRAIDHLWPLYGKHREWVDLVPATTYHFFYPLIFIRNGLGRWKVSVLPLFAFSDGYYDRGWWFIPIIKWGRQGLNSFFHVLEPLLAYERFSIAETKESETPQMTRTRFGILGGLIGWESERGTSRLRILWLFTL